MYTSDKLFSYAARFLFLFTLIVTLGCEQEPETEIQLPSIFVSGISVAEKDADYNVSVEISSNTVAENEIIVDVSTIAGSADDSDYALPATTVTIPAGEQKGSFDVTILGDDIPEMHESFQVEISNPVNATIIGSKATIQITNDDVDGLVISDVGYVSADSYIEKELVWEEQFNNFDQNVWNFDIGDGCDQGICGWGNDELQYYQENNLAISDGFLVIEGRKEEVDDSDYTSARITTKGKQSFQYGRIDIRAKAPKGQGMWPALWMLGNNIDAVSWPACGEIDIMEMVGGDSTDAVVHGTLHWDNGGSYAGYGGKKKLDNGILNDQFHVYSIDWNQDRILFYIDDIFYHQMSISGNDLSEFRNPFYFIINLAIGGDWPGRPDNSTEFPQWFIVDYIRVFK